MLIELSLDLFTVRRMAENQPFQVIVSFHIERIEMDRHA